MNMHAKTLRLDIVWGGLLLATLVTWLLGEQGAAGPLAATMLLMLAGLKGWWIIDEFMGLRRAALHWRLIVLLWLLLVLTTIGLAYRSGLQIQT